MTDKKQWEALVAEESKGLTPDEMTWFTPEGIGLKILYTDDDVKDLDTRKSMPGMAPFMRGLKRPCTPVVLGRFVNTPVSPRQKSPTPFTEKRLLPVVRAYLSHLI